MTDRGETCGRADEKFEPVRAAFARVLAAHPGGMQLSIYEHGREVVDLWGGGHFTAESLVRTASCTKGVTAVCALVLAERGLLDLDAPVADYWPEFAAGGKAGIPVRWLLTHQAGLALFGPSADVHAADLLDWHAIVSLLAAQSPLWTPGTRCGYHALTFGFLVGEVIRRVSGLTVGRFLAEHVTGPLAADFWIGLPEQHEHRLRPDVAPAGGLDLASVYRAHGVDPTTPLARAMLRSPQYDPGPGDPVWRTRAFHAAEIPAANGVGNARALARIYAACIGEVDGVRLLSARTVESARTPRTDAVTTPPELAVLTTEPPRFGLGFQLPRTGIDAMLGPGSFGHTGAGGRLSFAHPESGIAFGFTCDTFLWDGLTGPDPRWTPLLGALLDSLD
ncbi:serine hydrolase domain-containing protein [Amycolatopsis sp. NPDC049253]|uniref:serine hydrolase domain-containing protein n=1 Tax=Amycolatopsis sp. NPDC049253 TaxID=3155274 RepID=UPI0034191F71